MIAAVGGDPLTVMVAYASSVAAALIGITVLSIKVYKYLQNKIIYYSKYLPTNCVYGYRICSGISDCTFVLLPLIYIISTLT